MLPMAAQYGWSAGTVGLVQSSFFWGYLLTQARAPRRAAPRRSLSRAPRALHCLQ